MADVSAGLLDMLMESFIPIGFVGPCGDEAVVTILNRDVHQACVRIEGQCLRRSCHREPQDFLRSAIDSRCPATPAEPGNDSQATCQ
jgi:hypothetical protein